MNQKHITTAAYYVAFIFLGLTVAAEGPTLLKLAEHTSSTLDQISLMFLFSSFGYLVGSLIGGRIYPGVLPYDKIKALVDSLSPAPAP